jgi:hypothetical protein
LGLLELVTGAAAVAGGTLLAIKPDGSLVSADPSVLQGSPFADWGLPGVLLAGLVGVGFVASGIWQLVGGRHYRELSVFAGAGLIGFECAEVLWLGFQPLEAVFAAVGGVVLVGAWRQSRARVEQRSGSSRPAPSDLNGDR